MMESDSRQAGESEGDDHNLASSVPNKMYDIDYHQFMDEIEAERNLACVDEPA